MHSHSQQSSNDWLEFSDNSTKNSKLYLETPKPNCSQSSVFLCYLLNMQWSMWQAKNFPGRWALVSGIKIFACPLKTRGWALAQRWVLTPDFTVHVRPNSKSVSIIKQSASIDIHVHVLGIMYNVPTGTCMRTCDKTQL